MTDRLWVDDHALAGFEVHRMHFPDDYDGPVVSTLIRAKQQPDSKTAVLYIHGYMDYFFQTHLAEEFIQHGYCFYALDLRKYGRSLLDAKHPNFCKNIEEYFEDISEAIRIITEEAACRKLFLMAHSTGGLTSSLYAANGQYRDRIDGLILNSAFFDFNTQGARRALIHTFAESGKLFPFLPFHEKKPLPYMLSIAKAHHGEWEMNLEWRKIEGFPIYSGWLQAIKKAHAQVRAGLDIQCPILSMYADKSIYGRTYGPEFHTGDAVLSVSEIKEGSRHLGKNVTCVEIKDGLHDLFLSRRDVREEVFKQMFLWLDKVFA